jgi:hypothetical protein
MMKVLNDALTTQDYMCRANVKILCDGSPHMLCHATVDELLLPQQLLFVLATVSMQ